MEYSIRVAKEEDIQDLLSVRNKRNYLQEK